MAHTKNYILNRLIDSIVDSNQPPELNVIEFFYLFFADTVCLYPIHCPNHLKHVFEIMLHIYGIVSGSNLVYKSWPHTSLLRGRREMYLFET